MSSTTLQKEIVATSDPIVWHTDSFAEFTIALDSGASGETRFGFNAGNGMLLVPGGPPVRVTVAPDTDIFVKTTATSAVKVEFHITDLPDQTSQEELVGCIQKLGELLAFIFADAIEQRKHEIRGARSPLPSGSPAGASLGPRSGPLGPLTDRSRGGR